MKVLFKATDFFARAWWTKDAELAKDEASREIQVRYFQSPVSVRCIKQPLNVMVRGDPCSSFARAGPTAPTAFKKSTNDITTAFTDQGKRDHTVEAETLDETGSFLCNRSGDTSASLPFSFIGSDQREKRCISSCATLPLRLGRNM